MDKEPKHGLYITTNAFWAEAVAAEMDFYPKYLPWAFVTPSIAGAREDGKLLIDLPWNQNVSRFVDVIEAVIAYIEMAQRSSAEAS